MQKFYLILLSILFAASTSVAGVRFIVENGESYYNDNWFEKSTTTTISRCEQKGYTITECDSGFYPATPCPYDHSFYKECCPEEYSYSKDECYTMGKTPSSFSCSGLYSCY